MSNSKEQAEGKLSALLVPTGVGTCQLMDQVKLIGVL